MVTLYNLMTNRTKSQVLSSQAKEQNTMSLKGHNGALLIPVQVTL